MVVADRARENREVAWAEQAV